MKIRKVYYLGFASQEFTSQEFKSISPKLFLKAANLPKGWVHKKQCLFKPCTELLKCNVILHLWPNSKIQQKFPSMNGFSLTQIQPNRIPRIYFNLDNILKPPPKYTGTKQEYFNYIVQHELGHAVFRIMKHEESPHDPTQKCPLMYQQTRGTQDCIPNYL